MFYFIINSIFINVHFMKDNVHYINAHSTGVHRRSLACVTRCPNNIYVHRAGLIEADQALVKDQYV